MMASKKQTKPVHFLDTTAQSNKLYAILQTQYLTIKLLVSSRRCKIIKGFVRHTNDVILDEFSSFSGTGDLIFYTAFPLHYSPAIVSVLCQSAANRFKIDLPIPWRTVATGTVQPALVATKCSLAAGRVKLGVLHMKGFDALMVKVDVLYVIQLLQHKMGWIIKQTRARVVVNFF